MKPFFRFINIFYIILFFIFFSGIYRHDVPVAKYIELANQPQFDCVGQVWNDTVYW
jgi:hypothetical protein